MDERNRPRTEEWMNNNAPTDRRRWNYIEVGNFAEDIEDELGNAISSLDTAARLAEQLGETGLATDLLRERDHLCDVRFMAECATEQRVKETN